MIVRAKTTDGSNSVRVVGQSADVVIRCRQFQAWLDGFDFEHMDLELVSIQSADIFNGVKVIFVKMETDVRDHKTFAPLPGIVYLRGNAVAILIFVECIETREVYVVTVRQPRVPVGKYDYVEIPAGTMDKDDGIVGRMVAEVKEETGLEIRTEDFAHLGQWVPSTGGCDEHIDSFYTPEKLLMPQDTLERIQKGIHGAEGEDEQINVGLDTIESFVAKLADGIITDAKALATLMLMLLKTNAAAVIELIKNSMT